MTKQRLAVFTPQDREDRRLAELEADYRNDPDYVQHPSFWKSDEKTYYIHKDRVETTIQDFLHTMAIDRIVAHLDKVEA